MRRLIIAAFVALVLAGCDDKPEPADPLADENATLIARAEIAVEAQLRDPESVRYEHVYVARKSGLPVVCGMVNAKNAFGGYVGSRPFIHAGDVLTIANPDNVAEFRALYDQVCGA